jgi:hypothetical protein
MSLEAYFPEGIARGDAFVNRVTERKALLERIKANKHTVLIAPRRYGKTSLVLKVAQEMHIPHCTIDLLAAYNSEYVRDQIIQKVGTLVMELLPALHKAKQTLITIFQKMKPEISIGAFGQKLTLQLSNNPSQDIRDVLLKLDETAHTFHKKAVIFLDEFQQISQLPHFQSLEASIRHAVERSQCVSYVFSGSNRRLLQHMFADQSRPLYRLCQTMPVLRMSKASYLAQFEKLAHKKWCKNISPEAIESIFTVTELHPYYVNVLCQLLWEKANVPDSACVNSVWHDYVKTQRQFISHDMMALSANQKKILVALAKSPTKAIQSSSFTVPLKISASSAAQSLAVLLEKDFCFKDEDDNYQVLEPAVSYYLNVILWEDK